MAVVKQDLGIVFDKEVLTKLKSIEAGAEVNVQPDWDETDSTKDSFIKNKPVGLTVVDIVESGNQNAVSSNAVYQSIITMIYPVGSIYISVADINPSTYLTGTTWEKLASGRTLWSAGEGQSGGDEIEAGLPNITGELKSHNSSFSRNDDPNSALYTLNNSTVGVPVNVNSLTSSTANFDASRASSIYGNSDTVQPPAIAVFMWKRTA